MLLSRFSNNPEVKNPPLWCLEKDSGRPRQTSVENEAVVSHYYRLENVEADPAQAEKAFSIFEDKAKEVIETIVAGKNLSPKQRFDMSLFIHLQYMHTPRGRHWISHAQEWAARITVMQRLADPDAVQKYFADKGEQRTAEEVEQWRHEILERVQGGSPRITPTHNQGVAGVFMQMVSMASLIAQETSWEAHRAPVKKRYILSDHPVHSVDFSAGPGEGAGYLSSPEVEVTFPIDPTCYLLLRPGIPTFRYIDADLEAVRDFNLRTYASAEWVLFGPSQQALQEVREQAKKNTKRLAQVAVRPPRVVIADRIEGESQPFRVSEYAPKGRPPRGRRS
jgi:hypothetical protein